MLTTHFSGPKHATMTRASTAARGRALAFVALLTTLGVVSACSSGKTDAPKVDSAAAAAAATDSATRARAGTTSSAHSPGMSGEHGGMEMRDSARMREQRP